MAPDCDSNEGQRCLPDRRTNPTSAWGAFPPAGRRIKARRDAEHARPYFVDRFDAITLLSLLLLLLGCLLDGAITIRLLEAGGTEINPVMGRLLDGGPLMFLMGKYLLTVIGMPVLLIFKNHYMLGSRFRVGYLIPTFVALYAILIVYQLYLFQAHIGFGLS